MNAFTVICIIVAVLVILYLVIGLLMVLGFFSSISLKHQQKSWFENSSSSLIKAIDYSWNNSPKATKLTIKSFDKKDINAYLYKGSTQNRYLVFVHGYGGIYYEKSKLMQYIQDKYSCNVLLIEQRAHSSSKIHFGSLGIKEGKDVATWIKYLVEKEPDSKIILFGESMGGMSVLSSLNYNLPSNTKGIIVDSGFMSVYEQCIFSMRILKASWFIKFILFSGRIFMSLIVRVKMKRNTAYLGVQTNRIPICLLQGDSDEIVSSSNIEKIYTHLPLTCKKERHIYEGSGHLASYIDYQKEYTNVVDKFICNKY